MLNAKKAQVYWQRVVEHVGDLLEDLVVRWDREGYPAPRPRRAGSASGGGGNGHGGTHGGTRRARK